MPFLPTAPFAGETDVSIIARMLTAVSDDFVKTEGDFIYDTLAPCALGIEQLYGHLETHIWQSFPQLAGGDALDALALQLAGLARTVGETDTHLRGRLLAQLGTPSGAGTLSDYRRIIGGVAGTGVLSIGTAYGTVPIYIASDDHGVPSGPVVTAAQAAVDAEGIVGIEVTIIPANMEYEDDFVLTLGPNTASPATRAAWTAAIVEWFAQTVPGTEFSVPALMAFAGIPSGLYSSHSFDSLTTTQTMADDDGIFRATTVSVV